MKVFYFLIFVLVALVSLSFVLVESEPIDDMAETPGVYLDYRCSRVDSMFSATRYEGVDLEKNVIGGDTALMSAMFDKMRRIKAGSDEVVSILHIGDSHIQGCYSTNKTRDLLASEFGFAGSGLVMPYELIKTNGGLGYSIKSVSNWEKFDITRPNQREKASFTGYAIESENKAIEFRIKADSTFNLIRVLHSEKAPLLMVDESLVSDINYTSYDTPVSTDVALNRGVDNVVLRGKVWREYNEHRYYGFILENGNPGVIYHSLGVNGACFFHYNNTERTKQLSLFNPDIIIVSLGTNDSFYTPFKEMELKTDMREVVAHLKSAMPKVPILMTTPIESFRNFNSRGRSSKGPNVNADRISEMIHEVVAQDSLLSWDFHGVMGGVGSSRKWSQKGVIRRDGIHFTVEGYEMQGELLYDAIARAYNNYIQN